MKTDNNLNDILFEAVSTYYHNDEADFVLEMNDIITDIKNHPNEVAEDIQDLLNDISDKDNICPLCGGQLTTYLNVKNDLVTRCTGCDWYSKLN